MKIFKHVKLIYIIVFLIFFLPRVIGLGSDIANHDSSFWYPRMEEFSKNILRGDFKHTYQQYHPGVVLLWTSGTSKKVFEDTFEALKGYNPRYSPYQFTRQHFATKLPLVLMISLMGTAIFYMLSNIVNKKYATIFAIMLSLEPFFLGVSRFLHLSALTSTFMFTSFVILYYFYNKNKPFWIFIASAVLMGLAILTKIDGIISLPVNGLLILFFEFKNKTKIIDIIKRGLYYLFAVCFTFYALFPAMWVAPYWTISKMISEGIKDTAFSSASGASTWSGIRELFYIETIILRSLPLTVFSILLGLSTGIFKNQRNLPKSLILWTLFYTAFNIVILTIPTKIKDRYLINLYPPLIVFASAGVYFLLEQKTRLIKYLTIGIFSISYIYMIYAYHPMYSFYHSDLTGGPAGHERLGLPVINRGEFYAQVAQYINKTDSNPSVRNVILSDREHMRVFPRFFYGETFTNPKLMKDGYSADYLIAQFDQRDSIPTDHCKLIKTFGTRGFWSFDALYLYKCEGLTNKYSDYKN